MIDHMTVSVRDLARSRAFYERILAPLGYRVVMEFGKVFAFGDRKPVLWMKQGEPPPAPQHIAFAARDRAAVDAFHAAALAAGGRDDGAPGLRPHYHAEYYGAFVMDPDGYALEAVNHGTALEMPAPARTRARPARRGARAKGAVRSAGSRAAPKRGAARKAAGGKRGRR